MSTSITNVIPPAAEEALDSALETATEIVASVADKVRELAAPAPAKKSSHKLLWLLVAIGLGAIVFAVVRRRGHQVAPGPAPDAFGVAVTETNAATNAVR
jgi:hypothetical protein